ncbi:MAG: site-2 protease family protein [Thermotogae bacterium]|jgi:regulator of sigma E protease|nr:site-2 protease family protein [Thermotogota bacterium]
MILSIIYFIIILIGIVIVHEFGHFIFAKLFKVYVLEFAFGFGPKLFSFKGKETEYRFNAIPLGGYVRMAGEDPGVESIDGVPKERMLYSNAAWKRLIIVAAGPAFSIIAAYVLMIFVSVIWGFPQALVDWVVPNSPAAVAGLQPGDRIISVNGNVILNPDETVTFISGQKEVHIVYIRNGQRYKTSMAPRELGPQYFMVINGNVSTNTALKKVGTIPFNPQSQIINGSLLTFSNGATAILVNYQSVPRSKLIGIYMQSMSNKIASVNQSTGFKAGDKILSMDGVNANGSLGLQNAIEIGEYATGTGNFAILNGDKVINVYEYKAPSNGVEIVYERDGKTSSVILTHDEFNTFISSLELFQSYSNWYPGPIDAIGYGVVYTNRIFTSMITFLGSLFTIKNPLSQFTGPVGLVKIVGQASAQGLQTILTLIALITLNLGIINLIPFPALDGSHIVFALIEIITRKRVNPQIIGYLSMIGFIILMGFFFYITYLDIVRFY